MALNGNLSTMPLTDLLQWAATTRKTGTLKVERNKVCKRIQFREGRVIGCSSDDPPALLGHFLLSRGKITEEHLRQVLARQEASGESIGDILVETKILTRDELTRSLAAKAEDTIYGLFDWEDAVFRFDDNPEPDPYLITVDLEVQDVLLRGLERYDEMKRFRKVFSDEGIVLARTGKSAPPQIKEGRMARRIYESINGDRTLAEILLHAHASEYLVTKFLFQLHRLGLVEVKEVRPVLREAEIQRSVEARLVATGGGAPVVAMEPGKAVSDPDLATEIQVALRFMDREENEAALEVLNASYRANPGDATLRQLMAKAEAAVVQAQQHELSPTKIPELLCPPENISSENLSPEASFLPSLIDGKTDIKSILWLAPMRSVDVLRALKQMLDKGLIELHDSE